jgi:hypothetical protein
MICDADKRSNNKVLKKNSRKQKMFINSKTISYKVFYYILLYYLLLYYTNEEKIRRLAVFSMMIT